VRARGRHYSNEAEAMKVIITYFESCFTIHDSRLQKRARQLMQDEEEDDHIPSDGEVPPLPTHNGPNGVVDH
jgi:hypothetical protein